MCCSYFFFFKQKTAYEMRISDWSSDVCSSDLAAANQKAIMAQIVQMVQTNRQSKGAGDIAYNFTHGTKIELMYVSAEVQAHLIAGRLVIVRIGSTTEQVPRVVADNIYGRDPSLGVWVRTALNEAEHIELIPHFK